MVTLRQSRTDAAAYLVNVWIRADAADVGTRIGKLTCGETGRELGAWTVVESAPDVRSKAELAEHEQGQRRFGRSLAAKQKREGAAGRARR